jgi:hypothetical protein
MRLGLDPQRHGASVLKGQLPVFFDREAEARRVKDAILKRESMMICGPTGIGKTALASDVIRQLAADLRARCLYVSGFKGLQDLLSQLLRMLYAARDPGLRRQLHSEGITAPSFQGWLKRLSSSRLKGTLYRTVESGDYRIFLDHPPPLTYAVAKVIKELFWMRNTPVYLLMRDGREFHADQVRQCFYWGDRETVVLGPLPATAAGELLEHCIHRYDLSRFDLTGFREEILGLSKQVPGAIVKMCELAGNPRYQYGSQIKTKSLYIDCMISRYNLILPPAKQENA